MELYKFISYDKAIERLQNLESDDKILLYTIDFDNNIESQKVTTVDEGRLLIKKSRSIIINEDQYMPHIQLFSTIQRDIKNIIKKGTMHDLIYKKKKTNKCSKNGIDIK